MPVVESNKCEKNLFKWNIYYFCIFLKIKLGLNHTPN